MTEPPAERDETAPYRVLARKYRPARFADLIGQEAMVKTLTNALESGRLAHAFILTGVRGVGKTTTARIIARALNCVGPDGTGGPTPAPCGQCEFCVAIAQDRHMDVVEMDAASRTGIDDIRELIEGVRYRPVSARNKVYIIDEVHMLSRQAFNGLLKTLEEPPEHVVFIFATTEIRKVPVTVLSRCQRFDLRRVEQEALASHFSVIAEREDIKIAPGAVTLIARAADGSVRDGLSLLDQAIAMAGADDAEITEEAVKDMLGLADRARIFDLFEALAQGRAAGALEILGGLHNAGAEPAVVLQDLLELTHFLTRVKLVPATAKTVPETERVRGTALAEQMTLPALARIWQMLLKGLGETRQAPSALQAAEMVLIRLCHASELPTPGDLVKRLTESASAEPATPPPAPAPSNGPGATAMAVGAEAESHAQAQPTSQTHPAPHSFGQVVALAQELREAKLVNYLLDDVHLVRFERGRIEFRPGERAPRELAGQLGKLLERATGERWVVAVSSEPGEAPLRAQQRAVEDEKRQALESDPLVQAVLESFPGARIVARRDPKATGGGEEEEQS
ncbi:MAG: DNA polymerase III subunit gamma/tau [Pseudomonadota bacterium]